MYTVITSYSIHYTKLYDRSLGYIDGVFLDVHGAGGQRTDPKTGDPSYGMGPQGDVRRVYNYVRLVRNVN